MLPVYVEENTTLQIVLPPGLTHFKLKTKTKNKSYSRKFIFHNDNSEEFEIIIKRKEKHGGNDGD